MKRCFERDHLSKRTFGDMKGSQQPDSIVMIGSHRDAMTFGAIDPGSGTTVLLQDADAFHALAAQGWRPNRTIEFASWDGHELGLYGSAAYIYENGPQLRASVFQYINTDQLTTGDPFVVSASPGLFAFMKQICDVVPAVDGKEMLGMRDQRVDPLLNPMGGGSDHQNFAYMLGVPSTSNGYYGSFGAHHTAEDNLDGLRTYDPGLKQAVITAQVTGIQAMRAANATVDPLRIEEIPAQLLKDLTPLQVAALTRSDGAMTLGELRAALEAYRAAAHATDVAMAARGGPRRCDGNASVGRPRASLARRFLHKRRAITELLLPHDRSSLHELSRDRIRGRQSRHDKEGACPSAGRHRTSNCCPRGLRRLDRDAAGNPTLMEIHGVLGARGSR